MTRRRHSSKRKAQPAGLSQPAPAVPFGPGSKPAAPSYPSAAERERILARREELNKALIRLFVRRVSPEAPEYQKLVEQYGAQEVIRVTEVFQRQSRAREFLIDEPQVYRHYRLGFARFGGSRRFLSKDELGDLMLEHAKLLAQREFLSKVGFKPSRRESELHDLLITDWPYWEDITPEAVPARPADYPAPASYPPPLSALLTWDWTLDPKRIARESAAWQGYEPGLEQMVFDETLRMGWPGEPASWAPWHALHLLGATHASQCARRLVDLYALPDDWLSDCLPGVWANMGPPVEKILWDILDDSAFQPEQRGLASAGLQKLVQNRAIPRLPAIYALAERLGAGRTDNAIVNAYIIFSLDRLEAFEARDAIRDAFARGWVATKIMQPQDIAFLEDRA